MPLDHLGYSSLVALAFGLLTLYLLAGLRQVKQWEIALKFSFGRYVGSRSAGLCSYLPGLQRLRVDEDAQACPPRAGGDHA
jgi:regulator of protease activity HflC (stomatin/prohibitin superfamily)